MGFRIWDLGFGIQDLGSWIQDLGFETWDLGFRNWDSGIVVRIRDLGLRIWDLGPRLLLTSLRFLLYLTHPNPVRVRILKQKTIFTSLLYEQDDKKNSLQRKSKVEI